MADLAADATLNEHATLGAALGLAGFDELCTGTVDHDNNLTGKNVTSWTPHRNQRPAGWEGEEYKPPVPQEQARGYSWDWAISIAVSSPFALLSVSWYSSDGMLSATIPAPA